MKGPNDDSAETALPSKGVTAFHSALVTGTKLLTREEECTLKTALAFVVIKARATAKSKAAALENLVCKSNGTALERHSSEPPSSASNGTENKHHSGIVPPPKACDSSILDHLFCHRKTSDLKRRFPTKESHSRSLECKGDQIHINYMYRAAKTMAETWLVTRQQPSPARALESTTLALKGAAGHLAYQLQVMLVANASANSKGDRTALVIRPNNVKIKHANGKYYRRPSLSSKSAADSTSTPSSASQTKGSSAVVVTPATNHSKINGINNDNDSIGDGNNQNNGIIGTNFRVQEWIRSTLLEEDSYHNQHATAAIKDPVGMNLSRTILSCKNTTILNIQSSFHVYNVMIPQIARISPPLIGHIFQVVARLVKDLYTDKIALVCEEGNTGGGQLLDHLATSALRLLELCWTTEITANGKEGHRSFLLLSLQEILGDLLVPLSRKEFAAEHYRLTISATHRRSDFQQEPPHTKLQSGLTPRPENVRPHKRRKFVLHQQKQRNQSEALSLDNSIALSREDAGNVNNNANKVQAPRTLDPEAKMLLRMAVYRLILMGRNG